jgi:hypothetical protein
LSIRRLSTTSITSTGGKSSKLWDQETTLGTFESIATAVMDASGSATVTFSNIPQTYTHLQIRAVAKSNNTNANDANGIFMNFNGDTTSKYSFHYFYGSGSGTSASGNHTQTTISTAGWVNSNNYSASHFTANIFDIIDYKSTAKYKIVRSLAGNDGNGAGFVFLNSGSWQSNDAITSIELTSGFGVFMQYSQFALYGIRG